MPYLLKITQFQSTLSEVQIQQTANARLKLYIFARNEYNILEIANNI